MDKETLYRYFNGQSPEGEQKRVLDWLDENPENRAEMLRERYVFDVILLHADRERIIKGTRRDTLRHIGFTVLRYTAVVLLTAGALVSWHFTHKNTEQYGSNAIDVPAGQRVELTLPDGTKVNINALSRLEYPALFDDKYRRVKLTGEAFFDVTHDPEHPFIVETYACNVEVLGTQFNVEAYPETDQFITSLISGRVKVYKHNGGQAVELYPNQQARLIDGQLFTQESPGHENFMWREGILSFEKASFEEMMTKFEKYFGIEIIVEKQASPNKSFSGKIRLSDGIDHAMWVMQRNDKFSYDWCPSRETIYIR